MRAVRKRVLAIAGGVALLIATAAIVAALLFDINTYKLQIETAASEATGLDVGINGKIGLSFFPFGMSAKNIHAAGEGDEILSIEGLKMGLKLMPLLKKQLEITDCELIKPAVIIVKSAEGKYNFETGKRRSTKGPGVSFSLKGLKLVEGVLGYLDKKTGERTELKGINVAVKNLTVADTSGEIIKNLSFTGSFESKEMLRKNLRISNLKGPMKAVRGRYDLQPLAIATLIHLDAKTGEKTELKGIKLAVKGLSVADTSGEIINNLSFTGNMDCKEVLRKGFRIENLEGPVKADKGVFSLTALTMDVFGGKGEGDAIVNNSEADVVYRINLKVSKLEFGKLGASFGTTQLISGKGDLAASLTVKERKSRILLRNLDGTFSLRGDNLVTHTVDLDEILSKYETSQKFSLVDLGAFFIAGPLGTVLLKGYHYGDVYYKTKGGQGTITQLVSHWKIDNGEADATDCAFATRRHRVAIKGRLNLVSERYDNVVVALLDDKGCVKLKQGITGPFDSPQISAVSTVESLAGPLLDLYRKSKRFVQAGKCEVFYKGSVRQPR